MNTRFTLLALLVAFVSTEALAQGRTHRRRGVILGGLAGAAIGAAIGDKGDNETAGALIGGAVGAVAGGAIGNQKDQRIYQYNRYRAGGGYYTYPQNGPYYHGRYPQQYRHPAYPPQTQMYPPVAPPITPANPPVATLPGTTSAGPLAIGDVLAMVQSGLSDATIIQQIQSSGVLRPLSVSEVIQLHRQGVSEPVINAMQSAATVPPQQPEPISQSDSAETFEIPLPPPRSQSLGPSILGPSILAPNNDS